MVKITRKNFSKQYEQRTRDRKINDRHYYHYYPSHPDREIGHEDVASDFGESTVWTVLIFGANIEVSYKDIPKLFRRLPRTWEQLFFIDDGSEIVIYRGNSLGSGYRYTHGILGNAFALLSREREIKTFVLSQGKRGGLHIHEFDEFRVYGHELFGNYYISREEVDRNVPKEIRLYDGWMNRLNL